MNVLIAHNRLARKAAAGSDEGDESSEEASSNENSDDESGSDEDEDNHKKKGVQGLIEIENPNRAVRKTAEKVTKINLDDASGSSKPELSRREREEVEKQRAQANYQKLHAEGKTDQARADLARLAIIKQHRAEAAARREAEKKGKPLSTRPIANQQIVCLPFSPFSSHFVCRERGA